MRTDEYKQFKKFALASKKSEKRQKKPCRENCQQQDVRNKQFKLKKAHNFIVDFPDKDKAARDV